MEFELKFGANLVLLILSILPCSSAKSLRELTLDEYNNLASSAPSSFIAVYFDYKVVRRKYPTVLRELRKSSDILQTYGIQIAQVNCEGISIEPCKEENIYIFRNGVFEESLELGVMFNENSIVGNLLHILLKNEIPFISTFENGQRMIQEAKEQEKDLVLIYVKGLGDSDHAIVTKVAFVYAENIMFGLTTDTELAARFEGLSNDTGSLAVYMCKDAPLDQNKPCRVVKAKKMSVIYIARFLQMLRVPTFVYLPENGTTIYDTLPLSVDKLYIFTDKIEKIDENEVKTVADDFAGSGGIVIVDVNKHKDKLSQFGLSAKGSFPTAAYVPASSSKSEPNVEHYPKKTLVFSMDNVKFFLNKLLKNPKKEYKITAESSSLQSITYDQFSKISSPAKTFLFSKSYLFIAFCEKGSLNPDCEEFAKNYRRLVRTLEWITDDDDDDGPVYFVHVTLADGQDVKIGRPVLPHIRFYTKKNADDFIVFEGQPDYDGLLKFVQEKVSIPSIIRLPPSNADTVPIDPEGQDIKYNEQEEVRDEGQSDEEEPEYSTAPEETEDDEVAGAVWYSDLPHVPEDKVPSLTDKTFTSTRDQSDLLVVNFFQPWEPRSRAMVGPYVQAALRLGKKDVGDFNIRLARVNCFDWTDVCHNNSITTYPTIKLYRKGSDELLYQGPLDTDHLVKTVLMVQSSSPLQLFFENNIDSFLKGEYPMNAKEASDTAVVGLFAGADSKEAQVFSEAANELRGSFILGYATGDVAKKASATYGVELPAVFLIKRNDPNRPRVVFEQDFSSRSIVDFIRMSSISSFGELTPLNLPLYFKYNRPLLIAFRATAQEDTTLCPFMNQLAQGPAIDPLMLCWMPRNDVNDVILETYTGKTETPTLVLLHHNRGVLYHYKDNLSLDDITAWIKRCLSGEQNPSRFLKSGSWRPLLDGYDYLTMLDEEKKHSERKERGDDEEDDDNMKDGKVEIDKEPTRKMERLRLRKPEDFREEEEIKKHDEL